MPINFKKDHKTPKEHFNFIIKHSYISSICSVKKKKILRKFKEYKK